MRRRVHDGSGAARHGRGGEAGSGPLGAAAGGEGDEAVVVGGRFRVHDGGGAAQRGEEGSDQEGRRGGRTGGWGWGWTGEQPISD